MADPIVHALDDLPEDAERFDVAACTCGWVGPPCPDKVTAANFWGQHLARVFLDAMAPYRDVQAERDRAHAKFKDSAAGSREAAVYDDPSWLPILVEEVGEVANELNEAALDPYGDYRAELRGELVQVAAMACAWIDAIGRDLEATDG